MPAEEPQPEEPVPAEESAQDPEAPIFGPDDLRAEEGQTDNSKSSGEVEMSDVRESAPAEQIPARHANAKVDENEARSDDPTSPHTSDTDSGNEAKKGNDDRGEAEARTTVSKEFSRIFNQDKSEAVGTSDRLTLGNISLPPDSAFGRALAKLEAPKNPVPYFQEFTESDHSLEAEEPGNANIGRIEMPTHEEAEKQASQQTQEPETTTFREVLDVAHGIEAETEETGEKDESGVEQDEHDDLLSSFIPDIERLEFQVYNGDFARMPIIYKAQWASQIREWVDADVADTLPKFPEAEANAFEYHRTFARELLVTMDSILEAEQATFSEEQRRNFAQDIGAQDELSPGTSRSDSPSMQPGTVQSAASQATVETCAKPDDQQAPESTAETHQMAAERPVQALPQVETSSYDLANSAAPPDTSQPPVQSVGQATTPAQDSLQNPDPLQHTNDAEAIVAILPFPRDDQLQSLGPVLADAITQDLPMSERDIPAMEAALRAAGWVGRVLSYRV